MKQARKPKLVKPAAGRFEPLESALLTFDQGFSPAWD
jgi:hypothetical protein